MPRGGHRQRSHKARSSFPHSRGLHGRARKAAAKNGGSAVSMTGSKSKKK